MLVFIMAICLTFSLSVLTRLVPDTVPDTTLARMLLWTPLMLILHCLYRSLVLRKTLLLPYRIAIRTRMVALILAGVAILVAIAIWLPSPRHDRSDMLYIIGIGVAGEEILFRGLLWDMADDYLVNDGARFLHLSGTVWLTALAFGVMHFQYHNFRIHFGSVFQVLYSFIIGLFLGVIRLRTESVLWSVVAHAGFNSLFNLALTLSATAFPTFTSKRLAGIQERLASTGGQGLMNGRRLPEALRRRSRFWLLACASFFEMTVTTKYINRTRAD